MAQQQRIIATATATGRFMLNARCIVDRQRIAILTRNSLVQHGFPVFGDFDHDERRPRIVSEPLAAVVAVKEPKQTLPTTSKAEHEPKNGIKLHDWLASDSNNRRQFQDICRHRFMVKMYAEILADISVCQLEGWDVLEFPRMLRDAVQSVCASNYSKPKKS